MQDGMLKTWAATFLVVIGSLLLFVAWVFALIGPAIAWGEQGGAAAVLSFVWMVLFGVATIAYAMVDSARHPVSGGHSYPVPN